MGRNTIRLFSVLLILTLTACVQNGAPAAGTSAPPATATVVTPPPTSTTVVTATVPPTATMLPPTDIRPTATAVPSATATPAATAPAHNSSDLRGAIPPPRDNLRLAQAYRGLAPGPLPTPRPPVSEPLALGTVETFQVIDVVNNKVVPIEAELLGLGDHAYFWFQVPPEGIDPDPEMIANVAAAFDDIYQVVTEQFGPEANPGLDGDPRLHVLNAAPTALCGLEDPSGPCGLAGLVNSTDLQPAALDPRSNEREMFVMNDRQFGTAYYLGVLAHEFRHMIEFNYEQAGTDWEKEGSAVLAAELAGLPSGGIERGNQFLENPDQQLTNWAESGTGPYYGQGYLFNQYLFNRLGPILYREFAISALPGFAAIDAVATANGLEVSGESLWLDWLVALAVHQQPGVADQYRFDKEGLREATVVSLPDGPGQIVEDVRQYAADYYELPEGQVTLLFTGESTVPLLAGQPADEAQFWFGQRANYSNPRLTRKLDLRDLETATLLYDVYVDLEQGYDFAYSAVSEDDGRTWQPLVGPAMQGLDPADNPAGSALAERFYTGREQRWQRETIDLTPYVGQEILLRFETITDPILTYSGLAVDNVAVPELGWLDDGSQVDAGWQAEGFSLTGAAQPQSWHLQLITFPEGEVVVESLSVGPEGQVAFDIDTAAADRRPLLVVAATAPMTLEPAEYSLRLEP